MNQLRIKRINFETDNLAVEFTDGQRLAVPLERFPRLGAATPVQRNDWSLIGRGLGVHWEALDEDLSVENLLTAYSRSKRGAYAAASLKA